MDILIVDDFEDGAHSLEVLLGLLGHRARTANSGAAAVNALRDARPDLVLLDIAMPECDGYATARSMRRLPRGELLRIVALSGCPPDWDRCERVGIKQFLTKPVTLDVLRRVLDGQSSHDGSTSGAT